VISPWARRGLQDPRYSTQLNMIRTIEQVLGLPPMNQMDLVARPMDWLFSDRPDTTPYDVRPNQVPLDQGVSQPAPALRSQSGSMEQKWVDWSARQGFERKDFVPDSTPEHLLNHAVWYARKGFDTPYPGEEHVLTPAEVAARYPDGGRGVRPRPGPAAAPSDRARCRRTKPRLAGDALEPGCVHRSCTKAGLGDRIRMSWGPSIGSLMRYVATRRAASATNSRMRKNPSLSRRPTT
jgi:hypothetical protein